MAPKPGALWGASPTDALDTEAATAGFPGDDSREARWVLPGATTELEFVRADIGAGPSRFDALVPVLEAGWPPLFVPIAVRRELLARELEEDVATAGELGCSIRAFVNPAQAAAEAAGVAPR